MRRGIKKQLSLPFDADFIALIFAQFEKTLRKCHQLQDAPRATSGNDFWWWQSRFGEWIQEKRAGWSVDEYIETGKSFPRIWEMFEAKFTRSKALGVPNGALEDGW